MLAKRQIWLPLLGVLTIYGTPLVETADRFCKKNLNVTYWSNSDYVNLEMKFRGTEITILDIYLKVSRPLPSLSVDFSLSVAGNHRVNTIFNQTFDLCKILNKKDVNIFRALSYSFLRDANSMFGSCPVATGSYQKKNIRIPEQLVPIGFKEGYVASFLALHLEQGRERLKIITVATKRPFSAPRKGFCKP